jgi:hypothetical protein
MSLPHLKPGEPFAATGEVSISPDGRFMAVLDGPNEAADPEPDGGKTGEAGASIVRILALDTGKERAKFRLEEDEAPEPEMCFSADGSRLVSWDGTLRVRDTATGRLTAAAGFHEAPQAQVRGIAAAPAANAVAVSFKDRSVKVLDLASTRRASRSGARG